MKTVRYVTKTTQNLFLSCLFNLHYNASHPLNVLFLIRFQEVSVQGAARQAQKWDMVLYTFRQFVTFWSANSFLSNLNVAKKPMALTAADLKDRRRVKASVVSRKTCPVPLAVRYNARRGLMLTALINNRALTQGCGQEDDAKAQTEISSVWAGSRLKRTANYSKWWQTTVDQQFNQA